MHQLFYYRVLSIIVLFCGLGVIKPSHASTHLPTKNLRPIIAKIEEQIQKDIQKKRIPGCAVAIVYRNEIVYVNGFGYRTVGRQEKIDGDTVFQLGSVSKPVAATLASILENKGMLTFEDPINYYLPNFSLNSVQPPSALKIKHVLSHSTGVPRGGFNQMIETHVPFTQILNTLKNTPVRTSVGRRYDYNNAMYSVISEVTKSATQLSFSDALHLNLLQPLKMTRTSATYEGLLSTDNRASPHTRGKRGALIPCGTYSNGYYSVAPAGGINSTARDMATFLKAQMGGYPHVLSHRALMRIQTPQISTNNTLHAVNGPRNLTKNAYYGLGWRIVDFANQKMVFHGGWLKGFKNFVAFVPEQSIGIVVLQNGETKFSSNIAVKFFELFFDVPQKRTRKELLMPVSAARTLKAKTAKNVKNTKKLTRSLKKAPYLNRKPLCKPKKTMVIHRKPANTPSIPRKMAAKKPITNVQIVKRSAQVVKRQLVKRNVP